MSEPDPVAAVSLARSRRGVGGPVLEGHGVERMLTRAEGGLHMIGGTRPRWVCALAAFAFVPGCGPMAPEVEPLRVEIVAPDAGGVVEVGDTVSVRAAVFGGSGAIDRVEFWAAGKWVGTDSVSPFEIRWSTADTRVRRVELKARAYDASENVALGSLVVETHWSYRQPEVSGDGWTIGTLTQVGMSAAPLEELVNALRGTPDHLIHSILIVAEGRLVFEVYFDGVRHPTLGGQPVSFDRDTWHVLSSATKSFTSTLLGIAVDRGLLAGVSEPVWKYFPEFPELSDGPKSAITLEDLISMSAGIQWDQTTFPILDPRNDIAGMQSAGDPWAFYLRRPLVNEPGTVFLYSEGSINVVGEVIRRASGLRLDEFADRYLFKPLGVAEAWWYVPRPDLGWVWASGDLRLRPRDMAKFGQMYLQGGSWGGSRIVSSEWVSRSTQRRFAFPQTYQGDTGYGYAWWQPNRLHGAQAYAARGWGGQEIEVLPQFDLVVVVTGGAYYQPPAMWPHALVEEYVLPALQPLARGGRLFHN